MEPRLTREQSQHLIDLGIPEEKASLKVLFEEDGPFDIWNEDILSKPIFTISDFLNGEILPKEIEINGEIADLCFDWESKIKRWCATYAWFSEEYESQEKELIDALYKLAVWYYGEFLKRKKNNEN